MRADYIYETIKLNITNLVGYYTPTGDSFGGADWEFIIAGITFCILLSFILKLIGGIIFRK